MAYRTLTPAPKTAQGTGGTGAGRNYTHAASGYARTVFQPLGGFSYAPPIREDRLQIVPSDLPFDDGAQLIQKMPVREDRQTHARRWRWHWRSDAEWQQYTYPPQRRAAIKSQLPQKYRLGNGVVIARPFASGGAFLGYAPQAQQPVQAAGSTTNQPLGSGV